MSVLDETSCVEAPRIPDQQAEDRTRGRAAYAEPSWLKVGRTRIHINTLTLASYLSAEHAAVLMIVPLLSSFTTCQRTKTQHK